MSSVNQAGWSANNFQHAPRRYFQRPDGVIFVYPATEDYHIDRVLKEGWREVSSAQGDAPPAPPAPAMPDTRDEQIARLKAQLAEMEAKQHAPAPDDAPPDSRGQGLNRRSR